MLLKIRKFLEKIRMVIETPIEILNSKKSWNRLVLKKKGENRK